MNAFDVVSTLSRYGDSGLVVILVWSVVVVAVVWLVVVAVVVVVFDVVSTLSRYGDSGLRTYRY